MTNAAALAAAADLTAVLTAETWPTILTAEPGEPYLVVRPTFTPDGELSVRPAGPARFLPPTEKRNTLRQVADSLAPHGYIGRLRTYRGAPAVLYVTKEA